MTFLNNVDELPHCFAVDCTIEKWGAVEETLPEYLEEQAAALSNLSN